VGLRVIGHRLPAVRAGGGWEYQRRAPGVITLRAEDRAASRLIDALGPVHERKITGRQQLASRAIEHVVIAVLRRLHQHLARPAAQVQIRQDHLLGTVVVPAIARRGLVVPSQLAAIGMDGDDGRRVQVIAALTAAFIDVVGRAVAGADVEQFQVRVVADAIPDCSAAAGFPALARIPALEGSHQMRLILRTRLRIARHRIEAPA
jgi:hypothetical protein